MLTSPQSSWSNWGSLLGTLMLIAALVKEYLPFSPQRLLMKVSNRLFDAVYPYAEIRIDDHSDDWFHRDNKIFGLVSAYLEANSSKSARKLRAKFDDDTENLNLSMDKHQEITDEFKGATVWWSAHANTSDPRPFAFYYAEREEKRYYILTYNKRHRKMIIEEYLKHVLTQAKAIEVKNRRRKLFTNMPSREESFMSKKRAWSSVFFEHPASFDTVAMDHEKKAEILEDLDFFKASKNYYARIGKAWKRGYLLYGPPGTGKSTLIAAIANYMDYDIYDLELTAVKSNTELRKLLIQTSSKSILVIEDIDCSLDLTADRKKKKKKEEEKSDETPKPPGLEPREDGDSKVTLSGLLNFIDGLWSSCGEERLIIFTTNHIEKLDPALIRTGRMDKHIEMSYCTFEGFTTLANNFLGLDSHPLFEEVKELLEVHRVQITPADVAETLMPMTRRDREGKAPCIEKLIEAMKKKKSEKDGEVTETALDQDDGLINGSDGSDV